MARFLFPDLSKSIRKWGIVSLAFCWIFGLIFGVRLNSDAGAVLDSMMPGALRCPLSIVSLLISVFLPLLFSAFAVYIHQPFLLALICFFKALVLSFVSCGFFSVYGNGGWILWLVVLFHDILGSALVLAFSLGHMNTADSLRVWDVCTYLVIGLLAVAAEYCVFEPLLAELI